MKKEEEKKAAYEKEQQKDREKKEAASEKERQKTREWDRKFRENLAKQRERDAKKAEDRQKEV